MLSHKSLVLFYGLNFFFSSTVPFGFLAVSFYCIVFE